MDHSNISESSSNSKISLDNSLENEKSVDEKPADKKIQSISSQTLKEKNKLEELNELKNSFYKSKVHQQLKTNEEVILKYIEKNDNSDEFFKKLINRLAKTNEKFNNKGNKEYLDERLEEIKKTIKTLISQLDSEKNSKQDLETISQEDLQDVETISQEDLQDVETISQEDLQDLYTIPNQDPNKTAKEIEQEKINKLFYDKLENFCHNFIKNCNDLLKTTEQDLEKIREKFGLGPIKIDEVSIISDESHVKGRFVSKISFKSTNILHRDRFHVIRKDRSLDLDAYLTSRPSEKGKEDESLFSILDPEGKTLGQLSYLLFKEYGYVKPVVYDSYLYNLDSKNYKKTYSKGLEGYSEKVSQFVEKNRVLILEVSQRCGFNMAVAEFLTLSDLHRSNVFYEREVPQIIDPEVIFDLKALSQDLKIDSLLLPEFRQIIFNPCKDNLKTGKEEFTKDVDSRIAIGYAQGLQVLVDRKEEILNWVVGSQGLRCRLIPAGFSTANLKGILYESNSGDVFFDKIKGEISPKSTGVLERLSGGQRWKTDEGEVEANLKKSLDICVQHHDVPAFECIFSQNEATISCNEIEIGKIEFNLMRFFEKRLECLSIGYETTLERVNHCLGLINKNPLLNIDELIERSWFDQNNQALGGLHELLRDLNQNPSSYSDCLDLLKSENLTISQDKIPLLKKWRSILELIDYSNLQIGLLALKNISRD